MSASLFRRRPASVVVSSKAVMAPSDSKGMAGALEPTGAMSGPYDDGGRHKGLCGSLAPTAWSGKKKVAIGKRGRFGMAGAFCGFSGKAKTVILGPGKWTIFSCSFAECEIGPKNQTSPKLRRVFL